MELNATYTDDEKVTNLRAKLEEYPQLHKQFQVILDLFGTGKRGTVMSDYSEYCERLQSNEIINSLNSKRYDIQSTISYCKRFY